MPLYSDMYLDARILYRISCRSARPSKVQALAFPHSRIDGNLPLVSTLQTERVVTPLELSRSASSKLYLLETQRLALRHLTVNLLEREKRSHPVVLLSTAADRADSLGVFGSWPLGRKHGESNLIDRRETIHPETTFRREVVSRCLSIWDSGVRMKKLHMA